ncbi:insulinase family protein, partial [Lachnoanaerobaculum sp.]
TLTYENFLDMHSKYYHPSNSYIYLYGDMDMAEKLELIDKEYLDKFEYKFVDSKIEEVKPLESVRERNFEYPITENQTEENATYLSWNTLVGGELDPTVYMGFQILEYVLIDAPGAPLMQALIDAGIGEDVYGGYANGIYVPYFGVTAKNSNLDRKPEFLAVIEGTLRKLAYEGLDKEAIKAAINVFEFKAREADYGSYPKGLMYGLSSFDSWLYDADPTMHLRFENIFKTLREEVENGYFENLIKKHLLDNKNTAIVTMTPKKGLTTKKDNELKEKLAKFKDTLSKEELKKIYEDTIALKKYQSEPSSEEALLKIPLLSRDDISREVKMPEFEEDSVKVCDKDIKVVHSKVFTAGINYMKFIFNIDFANEEEIKYLELLKEILGYIDTKKETFAALATNINLNSGGVSYSLEAFATNANPIDFTFGFCVNAKILYGKEPWLYSTVAEVLTTSKLEDKKRIKDIIAEVLAGKDRLVSSGHMTALTRAGSYISKELLFKDLTKGIAYLKFLESIDIEKDFDKLYEKLTILSKKVFNVNNLLIHTICDDKGYKHSFDGAKVLIDSLEKEDIKRERAKLLPEIKNEGFETSSMVNYVARFGNFVNHGFKYTGVLRVLKVLLSYDYLWNNIRVK